MIELSPNMEHLAKGMLEKDIIHFGNVATKDEEPLVGSNLDRMIAEPDLFRLASEAFVGTLSDSRILNGLDGVTRHIYAMPGRAAYYAGSIARFTGAPIVSRCLTIEHEGERKLFEGVFEPEDDVVILDDSLTSTMPIYRQRKALSFGDLKVSGVVALVDFEQGGRRDLVSNDLEVASAMTISQIAHFALSESMAGVTQTVYDDLLGELTPFELEPV